MEISCCEWRGKANFGLWGSAFTEGWFEPYLLVQSSFGRPPSLEWCPNKLCLPGFISAHCCQRAFSESCSWISNFHGSFAKALSSCIYICILLGTELVACCVLRSKSQVAHLDQLELNKQQGTERGKWAFSHGKKACYLRTCFIHHLAK